MALLTLTQGNQKPRVNFTIRDINGNAVDLTGASLIFALTEVGNSTPKFQAAATLNVPTNGTCYYSWRAGDLDTPGHYHGQLRVTFPDGKPLSTNIMGFYVQPSLIQ